MPFRLRSFENCGGMGLGESKRTVSRPIVLGAANLSKSLSDYGITMILDGGFVVAVAESRGYGAVEIMFVHPTPFLCLH